MVYPFLVPRCLSFSMKICAQRKAGRSKRARRASLTSLLSSSHGPLRLVTSTFLSRSPLSENDAPEVNTILKHCRNLIIYNLFLSSPQRCAASAKCKSLKFFCNCCPLVSPIAEGSGWPSRRLRGILSEGRRPW